MRGATKVVYFILVWVGIILFMLQSTEVNANGLEWETVGTLKQWSTVLIPNPRTDGYPFYQTTVEQGGGLTFEWININPVPAYYHCNDRGITNFNTGKVLYIENEYAMYKNLNSKALALIESLTTIETIEGYSGGSTTIDEMIYHVTCQDVLDYMEPAEQAKIDVKTEVFQYPFGETVTRFTYRFTFYDGSIYIENQTEDIDIKYVTWTTSTSAVIQSLDPEQGVYNWKILLLWYF